MSVLFTFLGFLCVLFVVSSTFYLCLLASMPDLSPSLLAHGICVLHVTIVTNWIERPCPHEGYLVNTIIHTYAYALNDTSS